MKNLFFLAFMLLGACLFAFSNEQQIMEMETSCGAVWYIDFDQIPDDVTFGEFEEYVESVDDLLC